MKLFGIYLLTVLATPVIAQQTTPIPAKNKAILETGQPLEQATADFPYNIELKNAQGQVVHSSKLFRQKKKPVVLLFWLTTCGPCKLELTAIAQKYASWKNEIDFDFYAISTDFPNRAEQFYARVKESNWPFPAYHDFNRAFKEVMPGNLNGLPQVFVLDAAGKIVFHTRKFMPGEEDKVFDAIKKI